MTKPKIIMIENVMDQVIHCQISICRLNPLYHKIIELILDMRLINKVKLIMTQKNQIRWGHYLKNQHGFHHNSFDNLRTYFDYFGDSQLFKTTQIFLFLSCSFIQKYLLLQISKILQQFNRMFLITILMNQFNNQ
ncbi:unnamed protein product [Paramecium sonneborni]|uniref:Uncharacterized protein n=1 Tax=Paramecium sonneborni TaxID=65129 RepID=A0A8S1RDY1_9CILI|nr:unnamed protein product [Paramecium sonneborni]